MKTFILGFATGTFTASLGVGLWTHFNPAFAIISVPLGVSGMVLIIGGMIHFANHD